MPAPETKNDREQIRDGNTDSSCHLAVIYAGSDHSAEARPLQQEIEPEQPR